MTLKDRIVIFESPTILRTLTIQNVNYSGVVIIIFVYRIGMSFLHVFAYCIVIGLFRIYISDDCGHQDEYAKGKVLPFKYRYYFRNCNSILWHFDLPVFWVWQKKKKKCIKYPEGGSSALSSLPPMFPGFCTKTFTALVVRTG